MFVFYVKSLMAVVTERKMCTEGCLGGDLGFVMGEYWQADNIFVPETQWNLTFTVGEKELNEDVLYMENDELVFVEDVSSISNGTVDSLTLYDYMTICAAYSDSVRELGLVDDMVDNLTGITYSPLLAWQVEFHVDKWTCSVVYSYIDANITAMDCLSVMDEDDESEIDEDDDKDDDSEMDEDDDDDDDVQMDDEGDKSVDCGDSGFYRGYATGAQKESCPDVECEDVQEVVVSLNDEAHLMEVKIGSSLKFTNFNYTVMQYMSLTDCNMCDLNGENENMNELSEEGYDTFTVDAQNSDIFLEMSEVGYRCFIPYTVDLVPLCELTLLVSVVPCEEVLEITYMFDEEVDPNLILEVLRDAFEAKNWTGEVMTSGEEIGDVLPAFYVNNTNETRSSEDGCEEPDCYSYTFSFYDIPSEDLDTIAKSLSDVDYVNDLFNSSELSIPASTGTSSETFDESSKSDKTLIVILVCVAVIVVLGIGGYFIFKRMGKGDGGSDNDQINLVSASGKPNPERGEDYGATTEQALKI